MIVKICGIKTLEIALAAVEAGTDMLGFNFYPPSSRYITPEACGRIISQLGSHFAGLAKALPPLSMVGVFVNEKPDRIRAIMDACKLDLAQLSGDEPREDLEALEGRAFKAVRPRSLQEAETGLSVFGRPTAPAVLVDAHVKGAYGGSGKTSDWSVARQLSEQAPILLAGGLDPQNVASAVRAVNPWGVDVASGVESSPGVKDPAKIEAFIKAARLTGM
jgi:phosphoribosylanthranilate isomerase